MTPRPELWKTRYLRVLETPTTASEAAVILDTTTQRASAYIAHLVREGLVIRRPYHDTARVSPHGGRPPANIYVTVQESGA